MSSQRAERFLALLQAEARSYAQRLASPKGDWIVKGFIDLFKNVYTISDDTEVISKVIEIMLFPAFAEFADRNGFRLVLAAEQNHYPDLTFIDREDFKYAVDLKTTYRVDSETVNTMTLGAFTGYFRHRDSAKNITFPYSAYEGHFVLGVIYSRTETRTNQLKKYSLDDLSSIPSVVRDFEFFAQPKYRIAKDQPGSGNTKNIGSVNRIECLRNGTGSFALLGQEVFDDYWMNYLTPDMARAAELKRPQYNNLRSYLEFKKPLASPPRKARKK